MFNKIRLFNKNKAHDLRYKNKYRKLADEEIDKVIREKSAEIDIIIKRNDNGIKALNERHAKEIHKIRDQIRQELNPIISERNKEIGRLKVIISGNNDFYESVKTREYELNETVRSSNIEMERSFKKFQEGYLGMRRIINGADIYNRKQIKSDKNNRLDDGV